MSKIPKAPFKQYEGKKYRDTHVRLTKSMMLSDAYIKLSYSAKALYSYMKLWACGKDEFEYKWPLARSFIGSNRTYISSKDELIASGFIELIRTSKCSRLPNKYKFSDKWQHK